MEEDKEFTGYMRISEAARKLGVSNQRVQQLVTQGKLEFKNTPYGRVVKETSIDEYDLKRRAFLWAGPQREMANAKSGASGANRPVETGEPERDQGTS